jgi:hypothetical protein
VVDRSMLLWLIERLVGGVREQRDARTTVPVSLWHKLRQSESGRRMQPYAVVPALLIAPSVEHGARSHVRIVVRAGGARAQDIDEVVRVEQRVRRRVGEDVGQERLWQGEG